MAIKFSQQWFQEFQKDPQACCKKYNLDPNELPKEWQSANYWKDKTWSQCEDMLKKSRCASWFDWSA